MKKKEKHSAVFNGIMGVAVADAFGYPYQFRKRDTFKVKPEMIPTSNGKKTWLPAGCFSDDTSMTLATMDSLAQNDGIDLDDMMLTFCMWLRCGDFTPLGFSFDVGHGTAASIGNYIAGMDVHSCGLRDYKNNGNGSLMRILPLAYTNCSLTDIAEVSGLTHAHGLAIQACQIYIAVARKVLNGKGLVQALREVLNEEPYSGYSEYQNLASVGTYTRDEISSTGFVVDTLYAAMWCLMKTDNYRDCIMTACKLGLDTDSIGAVAGGLAGIMYGVGGKQGIPKSWMNDLKGRKTVIRTISAFEEFLERTREM